MEVAFLSKAAIGGAIIGMLFRDLGVSPVVPRSICFQTGVEAVGGRGGRPQLVDWSKLPPDVVI